MDIQELFSKFELDLLPNLWIDDVWSNGFFESHVLPPEYEMHLDNFDNFNELIKATTVCIKNFILKEGAVGMRSNSGVNTSFNVRNSLSSSTSRSSIGSGRESHQDLFFNDFNPKALVCLLSTFINSTPKNWKLESSRQLCVAAGKLYLNLLAIPGSKVYQIYNSDLYCHVVEAVRMCSLINAGMNKPALKTKTTRCNTNDDFGDDDDINDNENINENEPIILSRDEVIRLIKDMNGLLNSLVFCFERFSLRGEEDALKKTLHELVFLTRLEKADSSPFLFNLTTHASIKAMCGNAYTVLLCLCQTSHGSVQETVRLILQEMLPALLITEQQSMQIDQKQANIIKEHSIYFISHLVETLKQPAYFGVLPLVQHLCVRIPDKADVRGKCIQVVLDVLKPLPFRLYSRIVVWILSLCQNDEVKNRLTGLEIVSRLLLTDLPNSILRFEDDVENDSANGNLMNEKFPERMKKFAQPKFLLATIISRLPDVSATVRAKALNIFANLITSTNAHIRHEMKGIFSSTDVDTVETDIDDDRAIFDFTHFFKNMSEDIYLEVNPLPGGRTVLNLLEFLFEDSKVHVRKCSLHVLANIFLLNSKWMTNDYLEVLVLNCRDVSVSVRKLLVQSLTDLLIKYPLHDLLPRFWIKGVVPLLADPDAKSVEKVIEVLQTTMLHNLVPFTAMSQPIHYLPWTLLEILAELNVRRLFRYACNHWAINKIFTEDMINTIKTHVGTMHNSAAWFLINSISEFTDVKDADFFADYYSDTVINGQMIDEYCGLMVLEVVFRNWQQITAEKQRQLCTHLLTSVKCFSIPLPMIARSVDIIHKVMVQNDDSTDGSNNDILQGWAELIIKKCEQYITRHVSRQATEPVSDQNRLAQVIFTLGEAAMVGPNLVLPTTIASLKNVIKTGEANCGEGSSEQWEVEVNACVRAVTVTTLGKLSLQQQLVAKDLVPLFASILSNSNLPDEKINAMIVLADLCTRHASMVEMYLGEMCVCLKDSNLSVRENTLNLIIQLIQEDFLKLRSPIFFYLLSMLRDEDPTICAHTSAFFVNSILVKQKNAMQQFFVESIFHFNNYHNPIYSKVVLSPQEQHAFTLEGPSKKEERHYLYRYMLEHMMDDHRLKLSYKLCTDILAGVTDGKIDVKGANTPGAYVLQDALYALSCEEIRLTQLRKAPKGGDDTEDGEDVVMNMARKTLISEVVKKNMIENMIPIMSKLKQKLTEIMSPLTIDLRTCFSHLMKDHKNEINEILGSDPLLLREVQLDLAEGDGNRDEIGDGSGDEHHEQESNTDKAEHIQQLVMQAAVVMCNRLSSAVINEHTKSPTQVPDLCSTGDITASTSSNAASRKSDAAAKTVEPGMSPIEANGVESSEDCQNSDASSLSQRRESEIKSELRTSGREAKNSVKKSRKRR